MLLRVRVVASYFHCYLKLCAVSVILSIDSDLQLFNTLGPILLTNVCVILGVGTVTMPRLSAIHHLCNALDINSNVGGACGKIVALKGKYEEKLPRPES